MFVSDLTPDSRDVSLTIKVLRLIGKSTSTVDGISYTQSSVLGGDSTACVTIVTSKGHDVLLNQGAVIDIRGASVSMGSEEPYRLRVQVGQWTSITDVSSQHNDFDVSESSNVSLRPWYS
eukprot:TRINITY_DN19438_c0_g1_i1.p1 TRINITY_DN19438_c0_g1~~TRINITY_DN19438_c0_g1_i1.p1  ORF type:complete len:120 (-),score=11.57 TRINITY_DN19438_c0_g1_i1:21-380(-)